MAKVQIKSEKLTPFGGSFPIMEQFFPWSDMTFHMASENQMKAIRENPHVLSKGFGYDFS